MFQRLCSRLLVNTTFYDESLDPVSANEKRLILRFNNKTWYICTSYQLKPYFLFYCSSVSWSFVRSKHPALHLKQHKYILFCLWLFLIYAFFFTLFTVTHIAFINLSAMLCQKKRKKKQTQKKQQKTNTYERKCKYTRSNASFARTVLQICT